MAGDTAQYRTGDPTMESSETPTVAPGRQGATRHAPTQHFRHSPAVLPEVSLGGLDLHKLQPRYLPAVTDDRQDVVHRLVPMHWVRLGHQRVERERQVREVHCHSAIIASTTASVKTARSGSFRNTGPAEGSLGGRASSDERERGMVCRSVWPMSLLPRVTLLPG